MKKAATNSKKKLELATQTLRRLTEEKLGDVAGGNAISDSCLFCPSKRTCGW